MKAKKISVILIAISFALAVVFSCYFIFLIKKVDVSYNVSGEFDSNKIVEALDEFNGKSLLFLNTQEIFDKLADFSDVKVISVEKQYPNILKVEIKERLVVFNLFDNGKTYGLDGEGHIVSITDGPVEDKRDRITISIDGLTVTESILGKKLVLSDDVMFDTALKMAACVNLTDCIKSVQLIRDELGELKDARFITYTGVIITVTKMDNLGEDKILKAFTEYDKVDIDYIKSYSEILVYLNDTGKPDVDWIR